MQHENNITIAGAGIIGICSALWLQQAGFKVTLIDQSEPGHGASFGNACSLMAHHFIPLAIPGIWRQLPGLILNCESPLKLRLNYLPKMLPWLCEFLWSTREKTFKKNVATLAQLCDRLWEGYEPLLNLCTAEHLVKRTGFIHLSRDENNFSQRQWYADLQKEHGVAVEI